MKIIILRNLYTHRQISSHFMPSFVLSQFTHGTGDMVSLVNLIYVSYIASFEYFLLLKMLLYFVLSLTGQAPCLGPLVWNIKFSILSGH